MRCFDPVWRLNLIAINLKNIHWNKLIQILYGKPFTREVSHEIQMFPDTKFPQTFPDSKVSGHGTKPRRFPIGFVAACVATCIRY